MSFHENFLDGLRLACEDRTVHLKDDIVLTKDFLSKLTSKKQMSNNRSMHNA